MTKDKSKDTRPESEVDQQAADGGKKAPSSPKHKKGKTREDGSKEEELRQQVDELNDKYLRLYSEFDNYRRRTSKEKLELSKTASEEIIVDLLPVIDDFERAIRAFPGSGDCNAVNEGMILIYNKLTGILTRKGLSPVEAKGCEFDTDFHEAITYIPAPSDDMKGKVVDEIEKGYKLNDKVIRYAKVIIGQ